MSASPVVPRHLGYREAQVLARDALAKGREEEALPTVAACARRADTDAALWHWAALLLRSLDRRAEALDFITRAASLAPRNAIVAHARARILLEAGAPAIDAARAALRLDPNNAEVISCVAAAMLAERRADEAETLLDETLKRHPGWIAGHDQLARLRWQMGDHAGSTRSLERALTAAPRDASLWSALLILTIHAERFAEARALASQATALLGPVASIIANDATAASELREDEDAERGFGLLAKLNEPSLVARHMRHLLRTARPEAALARAAAIADATLLWPYRQAAWRLLAHPRAEWLEGDERLVGIYDIAEHLPSIDRLAPMLRTLHLAKGQQIDQSVRGGTQTDGALFARVEPEIVRLRAAVARAVERHVGQLPPRDAAHPTLRHRRDRPVRFSGSWSVRLMAAGHHANHVHPSGWLSSALYVAVPEPGEGKSGWLALGEPPGDLNLGLSARRFVEPKPGRLVLFPSTMWHGTLPFAAGERLSVAFDVAAPVEQ